MVSVLGASFIFLSCLYIMKLRKQLRDSSLKIRDYEGRLESNAQTASMGQLAASVIHEINNPLTVILLQIDLIKHHMMTDFNKDQVMESFSKIVTVVERIDRIIKGLRAIGKRGDDDSFEVASLDQIVQETLEYCHIRFRQTGVEFHVAPVCPELKIMCRKVQISQVLVNLVNNAADAIEGHGHPWIRIEVNGDDRHVYISVTDSGQGVPDNIRNKIMESFFSTKKNCGLGLGLSISKDIISDHHGMLYLDEKSQHTRFVIKLPRMEDEANQIVA